MKLQKRFETLQRFFSHTVGAPSNRTSLVGSKTHQRLIAYYLLNTKRSVSSNNAGTSTLLKSTDNDEDVEVSRLVSSKPHELIECSPDKNLGIEPIKTAVDDQPQSVQITPQELEKSIQNAYLHVKMAMLSNRRVNFKKLKIKSQQGHQLESSPEQTPSTDIQEEDIEQVYEAIKISTPKNIHSETTLQKQRTRNYKLSYDYLSSLKNRLEEAQRLHLQQKSSTSVLSTSKTNSKMKSDNADISTMNSLAYYQWEKGNSELVLSDKKFSLLREVTDLIHVNALAKNCEAAQDAFDRLQAYGIRPSVHTINALMMAYVESDSEDSVPNIFSDIYKKYHLIPNIVSYELLIKSLSNQGQYVAIKRALDNMKINNIPLTIPIYHYLIEGALNAKIVWRAWQIFDQMRIEIAAPTPDLYNIMIKACANREEAEKAMDLFQEMADKGIEPSTDSLVALMEAFASREDYADACFDLLDQWKQEGYMITPPVYHALLKSCSVCSNLTRGLAVWNEMVKRSLEDLRFEPALECYETMLHLMSNTIASLDKQNFEGFNTDERADEAIVKLKGISKTSDYLKENQKRVEEISDHPLYLPPLKQIEIPLILQHADRLWKTLEQTLTIKEQSMTSELIDNHIRVGSATLDPQLFQKVKIDFDTLYDKYQVEKTGKSYKYMLRMVFKQKELMKEHGDEMWENFLSWDASQEKKMGEIYQKNQETVKTHSTGYVTEEDSNRTGSFDGSNLYEEVESQNSLENDEINEKIEEPQEEYNIVFKTSPNMTSAEKEERRVKQARGCKEIHKIFGLRIRGLTRVDRLQDALNTIKLATEFREPGYLPPFFFKDMYRLVEKCIDHAEERGDYQYVNELFSLVPKPDWTPLDKVKAILRTKFINRKWWGFDALGIGKYKRESLLKMQDEEFFLLNRKKKKKFRK